MNRCRNLKNLSPIDSDRVQFRLYPEIDAIEAGHYFTGKNTVFDDKMCKVAAISTLRDAASL